MNERSCVDLTLPMRQDLVALLQRCVEEAARAFGMDDGGCLRLILAAEEVYAFLMAQGLEGHRLPVSVRDGGAHVEVRLALPDGVLPLEAFNLVPDEGTGNVDGPRQGLFLAARTVSSLEARREGREMVLSFRRDREYGSTKPLEDRLSSPGPWKTSAVEGTEALQLAARAAAKPVGERPNFVLQNGKAVDLIASGRWGGFASLDPMGNVGAGLFWERRGRTAFLHGPWSFTEEEGLAASVLDACLGELARSDFEGVSLVAPTPETPLNYFEFLGELPGEGENPVTAWYRLLGEDDGGPVYVHPALEEDLRRRADDLALPRAFHVVDAGASRVPERSALAVRLDPEAGEATLSTLVAGRDGAVNLRSHLEVLEEQGVGRVRFALDLGRAEEAFMGGCLVESGFEPRVLLPWAGQGDVLLLTASGR